MIKFAFTEEMLKGKLDFLYSDIFLKGLNGSLQCAKKYILILLVVVICLICLLQLVDQQILCSRLNGFLCMCCRCIVVYVLPLPVIYLKLVETTNMA